MARFAGALGAASLAAVCAWFCGAPRLDVGRLIVPLNAGGQVADLGGLASLPSRNYADFEGGNIGRIERTGANSVALELRSDNDDALPKFWRQWFYLRLDDLPTDEPVVTTLTGAGQWSYYLPFYSYDNETWLQLPESEVKQVGKTSLVMTHRFRKSTVYLARYVPYTYSTLQAYLDKIKAHRDVRVTSIGHTPEGRVMPLLTITDASSSSAKTRVVIHARTHPGEVGSSFLLEGLVDFLLSETPLARRLRSHLVFTILPMLNVDGVVAGNNRVSPTGVNLEGKWHASSHGLGLDPERAPPEVKLFHDRLVAIMQDGVPVSMALNLHSSAGEPEDNVFVFPHFGPQSMGYQAAEAHLYAKQRLFVDLLAKIQGKEWFNTPPPDGARNFLAKAVPETWWWSHFKDQVTALTVESTYGLAGHSGRWVKPDDMRRLGLSFGKAIGRFHDLEDGRNGP